MKKNLLILLLLMGFSSLFAATTVKDFFGKVKVKYDGDTKWSRIEIGQELPANTLVSTGFNSQVVLDLGNATLDILSLTRMTINEITESQDTIKTALFLQGGRIKADVGKIEGKINDFKIKSPVATASVRGTAFEFTGNTLKVIRGEVLYSPTQKSSSGKPTSGAEDEDESEAEPEGAVAVKAGGESQMTSPGAKPVPPAVQAKKSRSVSASTKPVVIKNAAVASVMGGGDVVVQDAPIPSVVQAVTTGSARITITIKQQ